MKLLLKEKSIAVRGEVGTRRAVSTFPSLAVLLSGEALLTCRVGTNKDCDDETIEIRRSSDCGRSWGEASAPFSNVVNGVRGSFKVAYITPLSAGKLVAGALWANRSARPGKPLFNPETEGCLPMAILIFESSDSGKTWSAGRPVPIPSNIGPPSLTSPLLRLADGRLALSVESNKSYDDASKWFQFVSWFYSSDDGRTWSDPVIVSRDPSGRIFNWDQRACAAPDGRVATFTWTYDSVAKKYLNIHRRSSADCGTTWTAPEDIGITDQAGCPAVLPDGRVILPHVNRFGLCSIRACVLEGIAGAIEPDSEIELYRFAEGGFGKQADSTGVLLSDMNIWSFGLPYAALMPDGSVLVVFYAGDAGRMDVHQARLDGWSGDKAEH